MRTIGLLAAGVLLTGPVYAQAAPALTFEIASIKPTPPDAQCGMIAPQPGGGLRVECLNLKTMLMWAYNLQDYQISGGPSWIHEVRWDILAKAARSEAPAGEPPDKIGDEQQKRALE